MNRAKVFAPLACALTLLIAACSQPQDVKAGLEPQFGGALDDRAQAVATDSARGRVYVAGIADYSTGEETGSIFVNRYDTAGTLVRNTILERGGDAAFAGTEVDAAGNVYVAWYGVSGDAFGPARLAKLDPSGRLLYKITLAARDSVAHLDVDAAGNAYVAVGSIQNVGYKNVYLRKYSPEGSLAWERKTLYNFSEPVPNPQNIPVPRGLSVAPNGTLYVVGYEEAAYRFVLTRYSSGTGRTLGQRALPQSSGTLVATSADAVYTGRFSGSTYVVQKRDLNGAVLWERNAPGQFGPPLDAATDGKGDLYLLGLANSDSATDQVALKYTSSGTLSWSYAPRTAATDPGLGIAAQDNGNTYVVGYTDGKVNGVNRGGYDAFVTKLSSNGRPIWFR